MEVSRRALFQGLAAAAVVPGVVVKALVEPPADYLDPHWIMGEVDAGMRAWHMSKVGDPTDWAVGEPIVDRIILSPCPGCGVFLDVPNRKDFHRCQEVRDF